MSIAPYLTAKRTIDDRALDDRVLATFSTRLDSCESPVRILEVGAGTGTMVARLAERDLLPSRVKYRGVDQEQAHVRAARQQVPDWLAAAGYETDIAEGEIHASREGSELTITFETADAFAIQDGADALVASAFLDLVSLPGALEQLNDLLVPGGLLYAPITYNGLTGFVPSHSLDSIVAELYHKHMQEIRDQPGGPTAGRDLLEAIPNVGGTVLDVAGGDWVIHPTDEGYPASERLVVEHLLETIAGALSEFPEETLPAATLQSWAQTRRQQLADAALTYIAHNLDVLARMPGAGGRLDE